MAGESLILVGFMGMGKSTVGPLVANRLGVKYYDTDDWMETHSGIDVAALVATDMPAFRKLETQALQEILDQEPGVTSTGGGIVSTEIGRRALLGTKVPKVWLYAPFEVAQARVAADTGRRRPLFKDPEKARALDMERQEWYAETSDYIVDVNRSLELIVNEVVEIGLAA